MGTNGGNAFLAGVSRAHGGSVHLRRLKLLGTASAVASAFVLAGAAAAQAGPTVPAQCAVDPAPVATGSTITCVSPTTITTPVISSSVDGVEDLTVVIGSAETPTEFDTAGTAVDIGGAGPQTLIINAGSQVSGGNSGANLVVTSGEGALTVDSAGGIYGQDDAVYAFNGGSGLTSITTGDVYGYLGTGIVVQTGGEASGNVVIDTTAGTVTGNYTGIEVNNAGSGDISITTANIVSNGSYYYAGEGYDYQGYYAGHGIQVDNGPDGGSVTIDTTAGTVDAYGDGIQVYNQSASDVQIATADILAGDHGILVDAANEVPTGEGYYYSTFEQVGAVTIDTTAGTVGAINDGIEVYAVNSGAISITTATVGSTYGDGIAVETRHEDVTSSPAALTINSTAGIVSGQDDGIDVDGESGGDITITTLHVIGRDDSGIEVDNFAGTGATTINTVAGSVTGTYSGIQVNSYSDDGVSITTATVNAIGRYVSYGEGESAYRRGNAAIEVRNGSESGDLVIDTTAGSLSGISAGIDVSDGGLGDVTITTADVTGIEGDGIQISAGEGKFFSGESGGDITVNTVAGTVTGSDDGIDVDLNDASNLFLTTGDVEGGDVGIDVNAGGRRIIWLAAVDEEAPTEEPVMETGGNVTINTVAGTVTGGEAGIAVYNSGNGDVSITTADVTAEGNGIAVRARSNYAYAPPMVLGEGEELPVYDTAVGGDITINSVAGAVAGGYVGINVDNMANGDVSITTADVTGGVAGIQVVVGQYDVDRISPLAAIGYYTSDLSGNVTIDSTAGTVTGGEHGIRVGHTGSGDVTITTADVVATGVENTYLDYYGEAITYTNYGVGVEVQTEDVGGNIVIDSSAGAITSYSNGINVEDRGPGSVEITTADITSDYGNGIRVVSSLFGDRTGPGPGSIAVDTTAGTVNGGGTGITVRTRDGGAISVTTADVTGRTGISVSARISDPFMLPVGEGEEPVYLPSGDITINTTAGSVTGVYAAISASNETDGNLSITSADVSGYYDAVSVYGGATSGNIVVDTSAGTATAEVDVGIDVFSYSGAGNIAVTAADVTGYAAGIDVELQQAYEYQYNYGEGGTFVPGPVPTGNITVTTTAGTVAGLGLGIDVYNGGTGAITITTADVTASGYPGEGEGEGEAGEYAPPTLMAAVAPSYAPGTAIFATNTSLATGAITVDSSVGDVSGVHAGILVSDFGTGGAVIRAGNVTGGSNVGIGAYSAGGTLAVSVAAGTTVTGETGYGVDVSTASETGTITVSGPGSIEGATYGLNAVTPGAAIAVSGLASVVGNDGAAMNLVSNGGTITVTGVGTITGTGATSMLLDAGGADISVQASGLIGGITSDTDVGLQIVQPTAHDTGNINLGGIAALGTVIGRTTGIQVLTGGSGDVVVSAANVTGQTDRGIWVATSTPFGGSVSVTSTGLVSGVGSGINAFSSGPNAPISVSANNVVATGAGSVAMYVRGQAVVTAASTGQVTGGATGLYAQSFNGSVTVAANNVTATEAGSVGIDALAPGSVSVTSTGLVSAASNGILAVSPTGPVTVRAASVTSATSAAINAQIGEDGTGALAVTTSGAVRGATAGVSIANLGTGTSTVTNSGNLSASSGPAILVTGRGATINNSGTITGFVTLTPNNDTFNNSGTFVVTANSDFGGGTDVFNNTGTVLVPAVLLATATAAVETTVTQYQVTLTGLESFTNNGTIDLRNGRVGDRFVLPGTYVGGSGATLGLDLVLGPNLLAADVLVINGAASGVTAIMPTVLANGPIQAFQDLLLVNAAGGSTPGAFVIASGAADQQLLRLGITFDSPNDDYILTVGPSAAAYRTTMYGEGLRSIWNITADNWTRHHTQLRDEADDASATPFWMTMTGDNVEREAARPASVPGAVTTYDVGYDQNYFGFEFGVDLARSETFNYGVMAGYMLGLQDFSGGLEEVSYDTVNLGAYASVDTDLLFASILAKYDHVWATATPLIGQAEIDLAGHVLGLRAEAGLRLGDAAGFFAEPSASLSYTDGSFDNFQTVQGNFDFAMDEGLLGKIGGRIGSAFGSGKGSVYLGGNYVHEFAGEDLVTFTSGPRTFVLLGNAASDYGEGRVGINFGSSDGSLSVTVEGRYADGGDREGFGGSGMVKFRF